MVLFEPNSPAVAKRGAVGSLVAFRNASPPFAAKSKAALGMAVAVARVSFVSISFTKVALAPSGNIASHDRNRYRNVETMGDAMVRPGFLPKPPEWTLRIVVMSLPSDLAGCSL
jgi:hypothetical protein